nr:unnamed protein product [Callosobruchus chinensis]
MFLQMFTPIHTPCNNTVMHLSQKLLNSGRTVVTDNYYTSFELAINLLDEKRIYWELKIKSEREP